MLWMGVIFYLSSKTGPGGPEWMSVVGHVVEYSVLSGLIFFAVWRTTTLGATRIFLTAVILAGLYGISDEFHQAFVPGRNPDPADLVVDIVAAALAAALGVLLLSSRRGAKD